MSLALYVRDRVALIERALLDGMPAKTARPAVLAEAMSYAIRSGGKRLRPIFSLASAEAAGGDFKAALPAACAIECLHTYTLVHDDLPCMDNDELRRGLPTVWKRYGESTAVLVGDALQTQAFAFLARAKCERRMELVRELSLAAYGVVGGQIEDIAYEGHATRELLDYVYAHKTGDLFRCACRMGVWSVSDNGAALAAIDAFASHLGVAFQIEDDLLDAAQAKADAKNPELSCLDLMSAAEARAWCEEETTAALAALDSPDLLGNKTEMRELALSLVSRAS